MKKISLVLTMVLLLGVVFGTYASARPYKVGYVMLEATGNSYNIMVQMKRTCEERGYEFLYESYDNDIERCIALVRNFITKGCDAMFIYTVDKGVMATCLDLCEAADVKVAFTGLMEEGYIQITEDEYSQGILGAERMIAAAEEKWGNKDIDLIIVTEASDVGDGNRIRMHEAFIPRLLEEYPQIKPQDVVWVDACLDLLKASSEVANVLSAHPNAKQILVPVFYDGSGGQGAMNALIGADRANQAILVSYHISDMVTVDHIKNSQAWDGSYYFPPETYVAPLFEEAIDIWAAGGEVENKWLYCKPIYVSAENIDDFDFSFMR